jgi:cysteine desulfurase
MNKRSVYLDYAAATPVSDTVLVVMQPYWQKKFHNPSGIYLAAKDVRSDINEARATIARAIGSRPSEIVFTAGGTEANNLAISGVMQQFSGKKLIISAIEHESVRNAANSYNYSELAMDKQGRASASDLAEVIDDETVLVSIIYANNEIGTIQPIKELAKTVEEVRKDRQKRDVKIPLYFHIDAAQAPNYLDIQVSKLGVDLMTLNSGKVYGPKQVGCLYVKAGIVLEPQIKGGGQEHSLRSGTENVAGIIGFTKALGVAQTKRKKEAERIGVLQKAFMQELQKRFPEAVINGSQKFRLPNNVHVTFPGFDNERLLMELDERGVQVATGSACSASKEEVSHVLTAIGLSDDEARASLRFSMGRGTTKEDIDYTLRQLAEIIAK